MEWQTRLSEFDENAWQELALFAPNDPSDGTEGESRIRKIGASRVSGSSGVASHAFAIWIHTTSDWIQRLQSQCADTAALKIWIVSRDLLRSGAGSGDLGNERL